MAADLALSPSQKVERERNAKEIWKKRYQNLANGGEQAAERLTGTVMCIGGGMTAGVIWSKFGTGLPGSAKFGNTAIEIDVAVGGLCVLAAAFGKAGKYSQELGTFGGGMLAARAASYVGRVLEEQEQRKAAA